VSAPLENADRVAVAFARVLRGAGLAVPTGSTIVFARALAAVGTDRPSSVYWAGRATLVRRPEDIDLYNRSFETFFSGAESGLRVPAARPVTLAVDTDERSDEPTSTTDDASLDLPPADMRVLRWSPVEVLRHADLATCSDDELAELHRMIAELRVHAIRRRSRRHRPISHGRGRPDVRRTVRAALRTSGEPLRIAATAPGERPRRLVVLLDVSGSMEPYARALARFAHAAVAARARGRVEVFTLGTRLHRITRELSTHDPDEALRRATAAVADWSGGTRLGESIRRFNDTWGVRGLARGAVVVILSDGWDRGDPAGLGTELARLRRVAHRIVWVNPLKATPGFSPLAGGMAAALPHIDELVEGHSVAALESLARLVAADPTPSP
jgi:uncharacterized protein with von Willebrand factor type A (vWA) domain